MLIFNPYFRPSVDECLNHKYLDAVRVSAYEVESEKEIYLELEKEE
jgi:hypothetical protein